MCESTLELFLQSICQPPLEPLPLQLASNDEFAIEAGDQLNATSDDQSAADHPTESVVEDDLDGELQHAGSVNTVMGPTPVDTSDYEHIKLASKTSVEQIFALNYIPPEFEVAVGGQKTAYQLDLSVLEDKLRRLCLESKGTGFVILHEVRHATIY